MSNEIIRSTFMKKIRGETSLCNVSGQQGSYCGTLESDFEIYVNS